MKRIKYSFVFVQLFFLFVVTQATAQDSTIGHISISSPTAASLGKYGDIPVSYNTGIPNISIPIYTVQSGSLKLPISLSYHSGGLKVQEQASWVGAGWSLNAGGVITRTVIGGPDDRGLNAAHTTAGYFADYGVNSYLFTAGIASCGGTGAPCPIGSLVPADDPGIAGGVKDGEPDLYFFNFNGYSGKFYFNDDRTPIIVPKADFKITPIYPYLPNQVSVIGILGFVITTPDGVKYSFGKNPINDGNIDATEITTYITASSPGNTGQGAASSWFLNKIVSADLTDSINLYYSADKYSYYSVSMFPVTPVSTSIWSANYEYDLVKDFINGVRLTRITFANGEVDLSKGIIRSDFDDYNSIVIGDVANTQSASLGGISIKNTSGFCKKDSFYFSFSHDAVSPLNGFFATSPAINGITSDTYRLRLDSIQETTCDGALKVPPYRFSYFTGTVPRKLTFGVDHWGFYNGVTSNAGLIPTYTVKPQAGLPGVVTTYSGADRDTHWPNSENGALQKITYPTGGYSNFVFESNDTYTVQTTYAKNLVAQLTAGFSGTGNTTVNGSFSTDVTSNTYELDLISNQTSNESGGNLSSVPMICLILLGMD